MSNKCLIKSMGLSYSYTTSDENGDTFDFQALKDVDLDVISNEFIAILGHNGSGKSTLAKNMNALLRPTEGTLWVKGYNTQDEEHLWDIRQNVGYVFQNPDNQIIAAIVEEDIAFGPENLGVAPNEIRKRVDESLESVGMSEYALHSPTHLSGGQKQRIAIAGVLAMKPDCIVLDEPTAMLDPSGRKEVIKTVKRLNEEEGITVILITHYMEEAAEADIVYVMDKGEIVMQGTPLEVFSEVDKVKSYGLDVPPVVEVAHQLRKRGFEIGDVLHIDEMVGELCRLKSKI